MSSRARLVLSVLALIAVLAIGTTGYILIEQDRGPSLLDAVYMTVITLSGVGYEEVWKPSNAARLWTIGVIIVGMVTVFVAFTSLATLFISGELRVDRERKKMAAMIQDMHHHTILCGYGRMGMLAAEEMTRRGVPIVVVENDPQRTNSLREAQLLFVIGDATDDDVLLKAGLMRARALVAVLPHDADNVYITLTAHTLCPELHIIARAEQPGTEGKLQRAGASRVICSQVMGAIRIANILTRPNVVDLVEMANKGVELEIDEYIVGPRSPLAGTTLRDSALREKTGASVVAIKRADGQTLFSPDPDAELGTGDTLVLVGPAGVSSQLDSLR